MMRIKSLFLFIFIFEKTTIAHPNEGDLMSNIAELHKEETTTIPSPTDSLPDRNGFERTFTLTTEDFDTTENTTFYDDSEYNDAHFSFPDEPKANDKKNKTADVNGAGDLMSNIAKLHRVETTPIPSPTDSLPDRHGYVRTFTLTTEGFDTTEKATFNDDSEYYDVHFSLTDEPKANDDKNKTADINEIGDLMSNIAELHRVETTPIPSPTDSLPDRHGFERTFTLTTEDFNTTENTTFYYDSEYYDVSFTDEPKANDDKTADESSKEYDFLLASGCTIGGAFVILAIAFVAVRLFYHKRRSNEEIANCIVVDKPELP